MTDDGHWKRLYPIRFRQLSNEAAFRRWHWVDFRYGKPQDPRIESCRVHEDSISISGELPKAERARFLDKVMVGSAKEAEAKGQSLALVRPRNTRFYWKEKTQTELASERERFSAYSRQGSMFDKELAALDPTPFEFRFKFEDNGGEHDCENGDWEAHAMFANWSRNKSADEVLKMMSGKFNDEYPKLGMAFAQGTLFKRPNIWTLLGVIRLDPMVQPDLFG